jgi:hypothetical protein
MTMRPDYGLHLLERGVSRQVQHVFYDFCADHVSLVGSSRYTTMVNIVREGREFALSVDFDEARLRSILAAVPESVAERLRSEIGRDRTTIRTIEIGQPVTIGIKARLGQLQRVEHEQFVPFILEEVFAAVGAASVTDRPVTVARPALSADPAKRFYHFPTAEARAAIFEAAGDLYDTIWRCVAEHNSELHASPRDLKVALARLIGPQCVEDVFDEPAPIGKMPTHVRLGDRVVPILETDPARYTKLAVLYFAVRQGILEEFGDLQTYKRDRDSAHEEGVSPEDLDKMILSIYYRSWNDGLVEIETESGSS